MQKFATLAALIALAGCTTAGTSGGTADLDPMQFCFDGGTAYSVGAEHNGRICARPMVMNVANPAGPEWRPVPR